MTVTAIPATDKQTAFIAKLIDQKVTHHFGEDTLSDLEAFEAGETLSKKHASQLIDALLSAPKKMVAAAPSSAAQLEPGIYLAPNGDVIKIKMNKAGTNVYAQVMVAKAGGARINLNDEVIPNFDFVYTAGLIKHITPAMKMSLTDAKAFYTKTGRCMNCKKELKVAASIEKGMGPKCAKMFA